jgi:hypothetical protein
MSTRIRYVKTNEANVLESVRLFSVTTDGVTKNYRVRFNTGDLSYVIFDINGDVTVASGTGATLAILKKRIKNALTELGYVFSAETRSRDAAETNEAISA